MKENIIKLWNDCGFDHITIGEDSVSISDGDESSLGTRIIKFDRYGFQSWKNSVHEGNSPIKFDHKMAKAVIETLKFLNIPNKI